MSHATPSTVVRARDRALTGTTRTIAGVAFILGLLGVLDTSLDGLGSDSAQTLFVFVVHPITGLLWLAIGLTGIAMGTAPHRSRRFLTVVGPALLLWALLALAVGDGPTQALTRDPQVVALHLIGGIAAIVAVFAPLPVALVRFLAAPRESGAV